MSSTHRQSPSNSHDIRRRVMQKNHYLVNLNTNERMVVFPPKAPGVGEDWVNAMNENGEYIRVFKIVNNNGIGVFSLKCSLVLLGKPGDMPTVIDKNGSVWQLQDIPNIRAPKARRILAANISAAMASVSTHKTGDTGIFSKV